MLNQQKRGLGGEGTPSKPSKGCSVQGGLVKKKPTVYKRNGGWFVFGAGVGTERRSVLQQSHIHRGGLGSQAGGGDVSLFSQETMQRSRHA